MLLVLCCTLAATGPVHAAHLITCTLAPQDGSIADLARSDLSDIACAPGDVDVNAPLNIVRIDVPSGETPRYLLGRTSKFATLSLGVVSEDGVAWTHHDFADVKATYFDRQFAIPLPPGHSKVEAVLVAVERATHVTTFDFLALVEELPGSSRADLVLLLVGALFTGMMLMPILFDLVFFYVLREKFILWHATLVTSLGLQLICSFGLYAALFDVPLPVVRVLTICSFNLMVVAAIMFAVRFIEPDKLPRRMAKAAIGAMFVFTALSFLHLLASERLGSWPVTLYFAFGGPACLIFVAMLFAALGNGSRTVRYLIVGMAPILIVVTIRVITFLIPSMPVVDANGLLLVGTVIEVAATAIGVASRFLVLKVERDRFHAEMDVLEGVAQRDPLTGLWNRRAIDHRFEELRRSGYTTFALIDLDEFKQVNDRHGHRVGDAVLASCADAMREAGAQDCVAIRLGGEEFVLLLRGARATERAEAVRQAIPRRVVSDVPGLERLVTASMGVIELPRRASDMMSFEEIYARADMLLYEAKQAGRNRMMYERLRFFGIPRKRAARA
jgi:diguanylate cyclase (GGDEF)-like protein